MLEKPELQDEAIAQGVHLAYGLQVTRLAFLPLGADANTAVYRLVTGDGKTLFLKLRKGPFDEIAVSVPLFLHRQGIREIISPLETASGKPWAPLDQYKMILYPFVAGVDGYQAPLSESQWQRFGAAMQRIHTLRLPADLRAQIPSETYSARWRELTVDFQAQAERNEFTEPVAVRLAQVIRERRAEIDHLLRRASELAAELQGHPLPFVLCHADIHPGNLLINPGGDIYIVDWDNPILAPVERDLMFFGGDGAGLWSSNEEAALFYRGYGQVRVDRPALAYYRYERVIEDIAAFCQQLFLSDEGSENREQAYLWFCSNFLPGNALEVARKTDPLG